MTSDGISAITTYVVFCEEPKRIPFPSSLSAPWTTSSMTQTALPAPLSLIVSVLFLGFIISYTLLVSFMFFSSSLLSLSLFSSLLVSMFR
jgi:hypothetical protein